MKTIDEIEKLDLEQLEAMSENTGIKVPDNINEIAENALTACNIVQKGGIVKRRRLVTTILSTAAVAATVALVFMFAKPQLHDTYSDPRMAYAEVERTFELIQRKTNRGLNMVAENETLDKVNEVINKINN